MNKFQLEKIFLSNRTKKMIKNVKFTLYEEENSFFEYFIFRGRCERKPYFLLIYILKGIFFAYLMSIMY